MSFVLDNSVALAWCFEDEQTPQVMALLDRVVDAGATAPQLWPIEALNGLLTAERRGRIDRNARQQLAMLLLQLPIAIDDQTASQAWITTARLAEQESLTAYDAVYLELAIRSRMPLATRDKALIKAAEAVGVPLLVVG